MPFPWTQAETAVIGMLHCPPLPGAPRDTGDWPRALDRVLADAEALAAGGADALLIENFGDAPFYPGDVPLPTVAHLTRIAAAVRERFALPLGINVLRNDGAAALAIAHAVGGAFIRVNVLCGARVADQGLLIGRAHELLRQRRAWGAEAVQVFADIDVKHSAPLAPRPLVDEMGDLISRGGADAVIVSGSATGVAPQVEHLREVLAASHCPVLLGSGVNAENVGEFFSSEGPRVAGIIVGASLKRGGELHAPIDPERVRRLVARVHAL